MMIITKGNVLIPHTVHVMVMIVRAEVCDVGKQTDLASNYATWVWACNSTKSEGLVRARARVRVET